jgi:hypothetical protein
MSTQKQVAQVRLSLMTLFRQGRRHTVGNHRPEVVVNHLHE